MQALNTLWLPLDGTATRYLVIPATDLTARRVSDIAMCRGRSHGHVQHSEGKLREGDNVYHEGQIEWDVLNIFDGAKAKAIKLS